MEKTKINKKNILFVISTNCTGNHLLEEVFVSLGFKRIHENPMVFWPVYQKAINHPEGICFNPRIKRHSLFGKDDLTNKEVFKRLYESWGYNLKLSEIYSQETITNVFRQIISDKIREKNLMIMHNFEYIHPLKIEITPGIIYNWSQSESDSIFNYITQCFDKDSFNVKYLCLLRHPLSIYSSMRQRFKEISHENRINNIVGYFRRIENIQTNNKLNYFLLKYEDFCERPEYFLRKLLSWIFPNGQEQDISKALGIIQRPSPKRPAVKMRNEDISQLENIAKKYAYISKEDVNFIFLLRTNIDKYMYDFKIIAKILSGNLNSPSVVYRHKFSFLGDKLIGLIKHTPFLRSRWRCLQEKHTFLSRNGNTNQPGDFNL